jgi:hypothetical protein
MRQETEIFIQMNEQIWDPAILFIGQRLQCSHRLDNHSPLSEYNLDFKEAQASRQADASVSYHAVTQRFRSGTHRQLSANLIIYLKIGNFII